MLQTKTDDHIIYRVGDLEILTRRGSSIGVLFVNEELSLDVYICLLERTKLGKINYQALHKQTFSAYDFDELIIKSLNIYYEWKKSTDREFLDRRGLLH